VDLIRYEDDQLPFQIQRSQEKIEETIQQWYSECDLSSRSVSHLQVPSGFPRTINKKKNLKVDQNIIMLLYKDVIQAAPFVGGDDILFGKVFAFNYLFIYIFFLFC